MKFLILIKPSVSDIADLNQHLVDPRDANIKEPWESVEVAKCIVNAAKPPAKISWEMSTGNFSNENELGNALRKYFKRLFLVFFLIKIMQTRNPRQTKLSKMNFLNQKKLAI